MITRYKKPNKNNVKVLICFLSFSFFLMPTIDELAELSCSLVPTLCLVGPMVDNGEQGLNLNLKTQ